MPSLEELHERVRACTQCSLHKGRSNAVPGEGSSNARVMIVGEGPGFQEDRQGRPFVGPAGQFLDELLASVGLKREEVFITNMIKCRPPNNRDPFPGEISACGPYLDEQIRLIQPQVIIPLGRHALTKWFPNDTIGKVRARARRIGQLTLFPLYHPAAALHNSALRQTIESDFLEVGKLLQATPTPSEPTMEGVTSTAGEQLTMF